MSRATVVFAVLVAAAVAGCAAGGRLAQRVGDGLTDYSKSSDSIIGKAAGFAGGVYTGVGCSLQGDSANADPNKRPCNSAEAASAAAAASAAN